MFLDIIMITKVTDVGKHAGTKEVVVIFAKKTYYSARRDWKRAVETGVRKPQVDKNEGN